MAKLWGGRFSSGIDPLAWQYNASLAFDWRLAAVDVRGSVAWANALAKAGILTQAECAQLLAGLNTIQIEVEADTFQTQPGDEDVHTAIERRLTELVGPVGGKLHTGRSRNDQIATDFHLWLLETIDELDGLLQSLQTIFIERAEKDFGVLMPGYTHLQRAQPVLLSHWWMSHFWPLARDRERLADLKDRASVLPLGSGALAGTAFAIDREYLASQLGFQMISPNSLDAVANRDSAAEYLFIAAMIALHLSRLAEMLILFSSEEFGFIELSDAYATGSSLMPQKKNPDPLELTRGKAATITGRLTGMLSLLKGLPSAYDKDLQEDKTPVFETTDTLMLMLPVVGGTVSTLRIHPEQMQQALNPSILATDLADYLVQHGIPFRDAHGITGQAVKQAQSMGKNLNQLSLGELRIISPVFEEDVIDVFNFQASVARREVPGGTGPEAVKKQIQQAKNQL